MNNNNKVQFLYKIGIFGHPVRPNSTLAYWTLGLFGKDIYVTKDWANIKPISDRG